MVETALPGFLANLLPWLINAVIHMVHRLPAETVRRLAALAVPRTRERRRTSALTTERACALAIERWGGDLCGLLNAMTRGELTELAVALGERELTGRSAELRAALWQIGAALERGAVEVGSAVQPVPVVLGGHLVVCAPPRGLFPPSGVWPRVVPPPVEPAPPGDEPEDLDELLAAADRALGVRLGARGRDKGAWGLRAEALLGIVDRGGEEPDWRGDVELKTVPVARDAGGLWRVVEDPAIAMVGDGVAAKLQRTLWLARADLPDGDATLLSWYLVEYDAPLSRLLHRHLHTRPKGPRGSDSRGVYLHKRFFAEAGLLASLNGPPC